MNKLALPNTLKFQFTADRFGPYSERLRHLLNGLDGSYLHCDKRLSDAGLRTRSGSTRIAARSSNST